MLPLTTGAWVAEMAKDSRFTVESFMLVFGLAQVELSLYIYILTI